MHLSTTLPVVTLPIAVVTDPEGRSMGHSRRNDGRFSKPAAIATTVVPAFSAVSIAMDAADATTAAATSPDVAETSPPRRRRGVRSPLPDPAATGGHETHPFLRRSSAGSCRDGARRRGRSWQVPPPGGRGPHGPADGARVGIP